MTGALDLDAYFERIRWSDGVSPTLRTLAGLLWAHTEQIPFENLDVLLRRPVSLALDTIQAKLVSAKRGGYCYEHGTLFAAVLEAIGFAPVRHAARVVLFLPRTEVPRTHMFLTVPVDGVRYVVDPGFGPFAPRVPVPLADGQANAATHWMQREGDLWTLHVTRGERTAPGWVTTLEAETPVDFEVANYFTATHPLSPFTNGLMLSSLTPAGRVSVMNRDVTIRCQHQSTSTRLADRSALRALLARDFGFDLPEVEQLLVPAIPEWR